MYFTVLHFYKIVCVSDMFKMFAGIVCFTSLKYMVLKPLVRTSSFRLINLFYNVSFIFCCIFLRDLGKNLFLRLYKVIFQFSFLLFWIIYYILIVWCVRLYGVFYRVALLVNSICFRCLGTTLLMILNKVFYSITL